MKTPNTSLVKMVQGLPATIEELKEYVLLGSGAVEAYRARLKAEIKIGKVKSVIDQTTHEGQTVSEQVLYAEARLGELLSEIPPNIESYGRGTIEKKKSLPGDINKKQSHEAQLIATHADYIPTVMAEAARLNDIPTRRDLLRAIRTDLLTKKNVELSNRPLEPLDGTFRTMVIDPPWPVGFKFREQRPQQVGIEYPTMTMEDITALSVDEKMEPDAHLYLWVTQKFLPQAFNLVETWKFKYAFTMVWHKNGGFQHPDMPQFNCEFVVVARRGNLPFITTKAFNTCFQADRREHSRKPEAFYELVRRVSPPPRLDWFARETHAGFDGYGNETNKFFAIEQIPLKVDSNDSGFEPTQVQSTTE